MELGTFSLRACVALSIKERVSDTVDGGEADSRDMRLSMAAIG